MDDLDRVAATRLRKTGQRYTGNRRELVELFATVAEPLTIPEILAHRRDLAQSSVYRNLAVLEQAGLVQRIVTTDEWARFELAEDLTEHHHHLICSGCGLVRDFTLKPRLERSIDDALVGIADGSEFTLQSHRLDLVGLCRDCTD
ncbi:MAG: Fur family transcriptional regulator, ferric uptake regulator [Acidimicrobiaceae bacterium]|jgi:Fe2+ or Zn2+ uptake regulation protein|nr:Fur family transcriptional regulator, ferric uptake regulator [Acidimicrobiaceae bacterium]